MKYERHNRILKQMKKLILILFLIISCENDNCKEKKAELINQYEIYFDKANGNTTQLRLLNRELQRKLKEVCD